MLRSMASLSRSARDTEARLVHALVLDPSDLVDAARQAGIRGADAQVHSRALELLQQPHVRKRVIALTRKYAGAEAASRLRHVLDPDAQQLLTPEGRAAFLAEIAAGAVKDVTIHKGEPIEHLPSAKIRLEALKLLQEMYGDAAPKRHLHGHVVHGQGEQPPEEEGVQVVFEALPEDTER